MRKARLLVVLLVLVILGSLLMPASVLGDGPEVAPSSMGGTWTVSSHWVNPEVIGDWTLNVRMLTENFGLVDSGLHTGFLLTNGQKVLWTLDRPWFAVYFGDVFRDTASGQMVNRDGNYGTWSATRATSLEGLGASGVLGAALGVE